MPCTLCGDTRYVTIPGAPQVVQVLAGNDAEFCTFRHLEADSEAETQPIDVDNFDSEQLAALKSIAESLRSLVRIEATLRGILDAGLAVRLG